MGLYEPEELEDPERRNEIFCLQAPASVMIVFVNQRRVRSPLYQRILRCVCEAVHTEVQETKEVAERSVGVRQLADRLGRALRQNEDSQGDPLSIFQACGSKSYLLSLTWRVLWKQGKR